MKKKKLLQDEIVELEFYLGMEKHRLAGYFDAPGAKDEIKRLEKKIKELKNENSRNFKSSRNPARKQKSRSKKN